MANPSFDAAAYKETTRAQWQDAAGAWHSWDPVFDRWLGPATELMLDLAGVGAATRVIDIAAGSGGQSIAAARRGATVLATDISSNILGKVMVTDPGEHFRRWLHECLADLPICLIDDVEILVEQHDGRQSADRGLNREELMELLA